MSKPEVFKREERYMVVKRSKLPARRGSEMSASEFIYRAAGFGKALVEAVVVEQDWPEYEAVWALLEERMTGTPSKETLNRAADKARIAELEKERDEWHRLFDSAGQLSKNACDDLNSAKSRIAELVLSLRTVVGMLHHRATTPLERQAIRIAETALAQQGKE